MTRQEALDYDNKLKNKLALEADMLGLEESTGNSIVDNYIMVIPDDMRKGMVFLGNEAVSYKFGNIRMDFKKAIAAGNYDDCREDIARRYGKLLSYTDEGIKRLLDANSETEE